MTLDNVQNTTVPLGGPCTADSPITILYENVTYMNTITMGSNQTINGSTTSSIVNSPVGDCVEAAGNYQINITNVLMNNCSCCDINVINPRPPFLI
jgi:ribosome-interacting GTPase 1